MSVGTECAEVPTALFLHVFDSYCVTMMRNRGRELLSAKPVGTQLKVS